MPFYKISSLPLPDNYTDAEPTKINDNLAVTGWCRKNANPKQAILWKAGIFKLLNLPGNESEGLSLNSKQNVVGHYDNLPFVWESSTGIVTTLKGFGQLIRGYAKGINDAGEITGVVWDYAVPFSGYTGTLWKTSTSIPINLGTLAQPAGNVYTSGRDINNAGFITGESTLYGYSNAPFIWNPVTQTLRNINNLNLLSDGRGSGINDLIAPQIAGAVETILNEMHAFFYDTVTAVMDDLGIPGEYSRARDINNNSEIAGTAKGQAVLWNGFIRIDLNHPTISDANVNGWVLVNATSINNRGYVVGQGYLNGDLSHLRPWILKPIIPIRKIPLEYMFPQVLWPGQAHDGPRPKVWPFRIPFPIPSPNPFQFVGTAFTQLNNILISKKMIEDIKMLSDSKVRSKVQTIALKVIDEEMKKLRKTLSKTSLSNKRNAVKKSITSRKKRNK